MITDELGHYAVGRVCLVRVSQTGIRHLRINLKKTDGQHFAIGQRCSIYSNSSNEYIIEKISKNNANDQRFITLHMRDYDLFKEGDLVKVYPTNSEEEVSTEVSKSQSIEKESGDKIEQIQPNNPVPEVPTTNI